MLLLCAGAAASLAGVWTLAGLSESSPVRGTPRVMAATSIGLLGAAVVYGRGAAASRGELSLPLLFCVASVFGLAVGAAKIEAALLDRDGQRVVRRSAGIVSGAFFGMAAVGAASLDLSSSSLSQARLAWALMFALVAAVLIVFAGRARYAGVGVLTLGQRLLVVGLVGVALLAGARLTRASAPAPAPGALVAVAASTSANVVASAAPAVVEAAVAAPSAAPVASAAPEVPAIASAAASAAAPPASDQTGSVQIEAITARGMLEADARGGVTRRLERLQVCAADPKNQQSGALSLKVGVDPSGSVAYSKATGGDLSGTPLGTCLLAVFYKMGFAAPASSGATIEITLRIPPR
jgi:hypothetical protein